MLERSRIVLAATAGQVEREIADGGILQAHLWDLVDRSRALAPEVAQMGVFDPHGQQVCGQPVDRCRFLNVADRDYFSWSRAAGDNSVRLFGLHRSRVDDRPSLVLARALHDAQGSFAGVLVALVPLRQLEAMLGTIHTGRNGLVSLRGPDLDLIARQPPATEAILVMGDSAPSDEFVMAVRAQPLEGLLRSVSRIGGIEREVSYRRLQDFPLYVSVGLGTSDLLSGWRSHLYWMLGVLTLFFGALLLITRLELRALQDRHRIEYLYDNAPCCYHSVDVAGIYRRINETELRRLGCTREELIGK